MPPVDSGCDGARVVEVERVLGQRDGSVTEAGRMKPSARATGMLCVPGERARCVEEKRNQDLTNASARRLRRPLPKNGRVRW